MLKRIVNLPDNVLGFQASGKVSAGDYQSVLIPELEATLRKFRKVRLLYVLGKDFDGFTAAAAWKDAGVGLKHLTQFDRIAVVTDVDWIQHSVKIFGFALPAEVRIFENDKLKDARAWVSEPAPQGDLKFEFHDDRGLLLLYPNDDLAAEDFVRVASAIDPYIEIKGNLKGVVIVAEHFPGWDDMGALAAHFRFVKDHRQSVERLAIVSDDRLLSALPFLARHFVAGESRHFAMDKKDEALAWAGQD